MRTTSLAVSNRMVVSRSSFKYKGLEVFMEKDLLSQLTQDFLTGLTDVSIGKEDHRFMKALDFLIPSTCLPFFVCLSLQWLSPPASDSQR